MCLAAVRRGSKAIDEMFIYLKSMVTKKSPGVSFLQIIQRKTDGFLHYLCLELISLPYRWYSHLGSKSRKNGIQQNIAQKMHVF